MIIVAQIIGLIAFFLFVYSVQVKDKKKLLALQLIANFLYGIQYVLLLAPTAGYMNFISVARCFVFYWYDDKKKKAPIWVLIAFCLLALVVVALSMDSFFTLIPIGITIAYAISSWQNNMKIVRVTFTICAIGWIFYNLSVDAYTALIGNVFELTSGIISLIRYNRK